MAERPKCCPKGVMGQCDVEEINKDNHSEEKKAAWSLLGSGLRVGCYCKKVEYVQG